MRRLSVVLFVTALLAGLLGTLPGAAADDPPSRVRAGVGTADATWHVGAGAGQYATDRDAAGEAQGGGFDPNLHSTKSEPSWGVQSRLSIRALVVEGNNGERVALVKTDNYLAQDMLQRRVEQLLDPALGITRHNIVWSASHNHSSPYDLTLAAGVWIFEDAFNLRMFEYEARQAAAAITQAATSLVPVRMGATKVEHTIFKANVVGPQLADDGTPSGYPKDFGDTDLSILRFDDVSNPAAPKPLATWVNWGQHPESLDGYNLITADYLSALQRNVDRATGSTMLFSQGDVGSAEGPYGGRAGRQQLPDGVWREWAHMGFAQMERGAYYLSQDVLKAWRQIGDGDPSVAMPFSTDFPVRVAENWVPGPVSHPYPSVTNCRSESTLRGNLGGPGAPDCTRSGKVLPDAGIYEAIKSAGLPVPEHYDVPSFMSVEENVRIHLQAVRLGDVLLASCSCEAQVDLIRNLKSRTDGTTGNIEDGYPWDERCAPVEDQYACDNLINGDGPLMVTTAKFERMKAQIHNDAAGWDAPDNAPYANAEPADPAKIKGNFTKQELQDVCVSCAGYKLPIGLGHTGDYDGYTVSYREYMARDAYRTALTSYGAHTADYMVTRLVKMAAALQDGPAVQPEANDVMAKADEARAQATALALGQASSAAYEGWLASLPDDVGPAGVVAEPADIKRFDAATFSWVGGSNAVDNPHVAVEQRQADGTWAPFADQSGEVQTFLALPKGVTSVADARTGAQQWRWTANFEAFDPFPTGAARQVPDGTYRFVVGGLIRTGGAVAPYHLASQPFTVSPWDGVRVQDVAPLADGRVSVEIGPIVYPRTYASTAAARFVKDQAGAQVCKTCAFRPWASTGTPASVQVTVVRPDTGEALRTLDAALDPATGRWVTDGVVYTDEAIAVLPGAVRDGFGETNAVGQAGMFGTAERPAAPASGGDPSPSAPQMGPGGSSPEHSPWWRPVNSLSAGLSGLLVLLLAAALLAGVGAGARRPARRG
ncbi:MAG TPA: neutral/alkaline non-lysosomal ceramidase N-terminal domain-containing protein [Acidimicrobiales bacterium]|nr:neutral/alkaline non-lysosomal ceramidase N-terminal domain-containing protein [Acidimicrobiales bacterium]